MLAAVFLEDPAGLTPVMAGIQSRRPLPFVKPPLHGLGGWCGPVGNRRFVMLFTCLGIGVGLHADGYARPAVALIIAICDSPWLLVFVQGPRARPSGSSVDQARVTGRSRYGGGLRKRRRGSFYLFIFHVCHAIPVLLSFIATGAFISWVVCYFPAVEARRRVWRCSMLDSRRWGSADGRMKRVFRRETESESGDDLPLVRNGWAGRPWHWSDRHWQSQGHGKYCAQRWPAFRSIGRGNPAKGNAQRLRPGVSGPASRKSTPPRLHCSKARPIAGKDL